MSESVGGPHDISPPSLPEGPEKESVSAGKLLGHQVSKNLSPRRQEAIQKILKDRYGIEAEGKNIGSFIENVRGQADRVNYVSLAKAWLWSLNPNKRMAARIVQAAKLIEQKQSASVEDAYGRAKGRFAAWGRHPTDMILPGTMGATGLGLAALLVCGVVGLGGAVAFGITVAPFVVVGAGIAGLAVGNRIWENHQVKKWEGKDPQIDSVKTVWEEKSKKP